MNFDIHYFMVAYTRKEKFQFIGETNNTRSNKVSGVGMATGFEHGVCRLIDVPASNPSIGRIHPRLMDGVDAFRFPPLVCEGALVIKRPDHA